MSTAWKYLKWTLISSTGLFLALVIFLFFWIDPNDYRDDISKLAKDKAGLILEIKGQISWNFYPAIGFAVADVSLATAEGEAPLASINKAAISVELMPLFSKQVHVRTLFVDGMIANLVVDENGVGNWAALTAASTEPSAPESATDTPIQISVPKLVITNTIIDYDDRQAKSRYKASIAELVIEDISLDKEFPLHLVATVEDNTGLKAHINSRAFVRADLTAERYTLRAMELKGEVAGILEQPFNLLLNTDLVADLQTGQMTFSALTLTANNLAIAARPMQATVQGEMTVDINADTAHLGPLQFTLGQLSGALTLDAAAISGETSYTGTLDLASFNAKQVMRDFAIEPPITADPLAMTKVTVKGNIDGTLTRATLSHLDIKLDDTRIQGSAGITDLDSSALAFDLVLDNIKADRYLPPAAAPAEQAVATATQTTTAAQTAPATTPTAAAKKVEPLLPMETLRTLNLDGKIAIKKMALMGWEMSQLAATVHAKDGVVKIDPFSAAVLEGTMNGSVHIDARGKEPRIVTLLKLNRVEVGGLIKHFTGRDLLVGKTSLNLNMDSTGNDIDTLLQKAIGGVDLTFSEAVLKGMSLNNMLSETLTKQLGAFSMLVPDYQQKLPQSLSQDTTFTTLATQATLKDGIAKVPAFNAGIKEGSVKGGGQFNLVTQDFDYVVAMRTDKLKDSKYFADAEFPIHCKGNVGSSPKDWCRPDTQVIGDMLKRAAVKSVTDRAKSDVIKKLGIESADTETIKKEATEQVQEKAKEQVNKEVEKAMKRFF